jgi:hypothetical protein
MNPATALLIVKLIELIRIYGSALVIAGIEALKSKAELTLADLDELELQLKHPSEYMPRP